MAIVRENTKTNVRVAIIGCGNIASLWDESSSAPLRGPAKTHAKAFAKNSNCEIVSMMDKSLERAKEAAQFWKVSHATDSLSELLEQNPDVICLCTPEKARWNILQALPEKKGLVIVCEKPLAPTAAEALKIQKLARDREWNFLVNYTRRFGTGFQELKKITQSQALGEPTKILGQYGKGLRNNGTHMIDTLNFLFGKPSKPILLGEIQDDRTSEDPTVDFQLHYGSVPAYVTANDHRDFTVFEIDLFFKKGRVQISERGEKIQVFATVPDPVYPGYTILKQDRTLSSGLKDHFENIAAQALALTKSSEIHQESLASSVEMIQTLEKIKSRFLWQIQN